MKLATLGKIQIGIAITVFIIVLIFNIIAYNFGLANLENRAQDMSELHRNLYTPGVNATKQEVSNNVFHFISVLQPLFGFYVMLATNIIVGDVIIFLLTTLLIINGLAMLSKD